MAIRVSDLSRAYNLSPREEEVLQLIAQGDTVAEIEEVLYVSQGTVKAHINHIYRKFNIHSKKRAVRTAQRCGEACAQGSPVFFVRLGRTKNGKQDRGGTGCACKNAPRRGFAEEPFSAVARLTRGVG